MAERIRPCKMIVRRTRKVRQGRKISQGDHSIKSRFSTFFEKDQERVRNADAESALYRVQEVAV